MDRLTIAMGILLLAASSAVAGPILNEVFMETPSHFRLTFDHGPVDITPPPPGSNDNHRHDVRRFGGASDFWNVWVRVFVRERPVAGDRVILRVLNSRRLQTTRHKHALHAGELLLGDPAPSERLNMDVEAADAVGGVAMDTAAAFSLHRGLRPPHRDLYRASLTATVFGNDITGFSVEVTGQHVPEPASVVLGGIGLAMLAAGKYFRRSGRSG